MKKLMVLFIFTSLLLISCSSNKHQNNQSSTNSSAKKDVQVASLETKNIKPTAELKDKSLANTKSDNKTTPASIEQINKVQSETKDTNATVEAKDKSPANIKSDNKTNSTPTEEINKVKPEYQKYSRFLKINDNVAKFIKEDIDLDGKKEVVIAFGEDDDQVDVYILRENGNTLQEIEKLDGGYGIYGVSLVQMQGNKQKYIEVILSNGAGLSGFALYEVVKNSVNQIAYSASATGAGDDYLMSAANNDIYDGYVQKRDSYDVLYFSTSSYYKWNGQNFDFVSCDVDTGDYPDKPEGVAYQFLKLNTLWDEYRNSNNVVNRLNELNISNKTLNMDKIDDNWRVAFQIDDDIIDSAQQNGSSAKVESPLGISFGLTKNNNKWQITDMTGDMVINKIQQ